MRLCGRGAAMFPLVHPAVAWLPWMGVKRGFKKNVINQPQSVGEEKRKFRYLHSEVQLIPCARKIEINQFTGPLRLERFSIVGAQTYCPMQISSSFGLAVFIT